MSQTDFKSFMAGGALTGRLIAKYTANRGECVLATAATDALAGVVDLDAAAGQMADVAIGDCFEVKLGGTVAAGDPLTADNTSRAIKAVKSNGVVVYCIGFAQAPGIAGDIVPYVVSPFVIAG